MAEETHTHTHPTSFWRKNWKHFYIYYLTLASQHPQHPFEVIKMQILGHRKTFKIKLNYDLQKKKKTKPWSIKAIRIPEFQRLKADRE